MMVTEQTGNAVLAQRQLRRKSITTTLNVYENSVSDTAFAGGMKTPK
jgi:hypothetical protein